MASCQQPQVVSLHICVGHREPMRVVDSANLVTGLGIEGDRHASTEGPRKSRQVLVMDEDVLKSFGPIPWRGPREYHDLRHRTALAAIGAEARTRRRSCTGDNGTLYSLPANGRSPYGAATGAGWKARNASLCSSRWHRPGGRHSSRPTGRYNRLAPPHRRRYPGAPQMFLDPSSKRPLSMQRTNPDCGFLVPFVVL